MSAAAPTDFPLLQPSPDEFAEAVNPKKQGMATVDLIQLLRTYFDDAERARESGTEARDEAWELNWNAYWGRTDNSQKAEWQSREVMPEVQIFVDRWTAGMRGTLAVGQEWHAVDDPLDSSGTFAPLMNRFLTVLLGHSGRNASGQPVGFDATFGDVAKSAALMAACASVHVEDGRVLVDAVDPREIFLDPKGRGLYQCRRYEVDRWQLEKFKARKDSAGNPMFHAAAIDRLLGDENQEGVDERERSSGGREDDSAQERRLPITLKEFRATLIDRDGKMVAENQLVVMANDREIIRGPEDNPFWHKKWWIVFMPPIQVPFSQYGRSFVEGFRSIAATFTEFTNLLIDAAFASSISAHMVWLEALDNPDQVQNGIFPGLMVTADADWAAGQDFVKEIDVGKFSPAMVTVWQALKAELREGASINETSLGQLPPKGDITAAEIGASTAGTNALQGSIATDFDTRFLAPLLELVFWTGIQVFDPEKDEVLAAELGEPITQMILAQRDQIRKRKFNFKAFGITAAIDRGKRLQNLMGFLQTISSSPELLAEFGRTKSVGKLMDMLMALFEVDPTRLEKSEQEIKEDEARQAQQAAIAAGGGEGLEGPQPGGTPPAFPGGETV